MLELTDLLKFLYVKIDLLLVLELKILPKANLNQAKIILTVFAAHH